MASSKNIIIYALKQALLEIEPTAQSFGIDTKTFAWSCCHICYPSDNDKKQIIKLLITAFDTNKDIKNGTKRKYGIYKCLASSLKESGINNNVYWGGHAFPLCVEIAIKRECGDNKSIKDVIQSRFEYAATQKKGKISAQKLMKLWLKHLANNAQLQNDKN